MSDRISKTGNIQSVRKSIRLVDATIRDGGLMNNFGFTDDFVRALYASNIASGVDVMEFGYRVSDKLFDRSKFGKWKFSSEEDIRGIVGDNKSDMKISVMCDVGRIDLAGEKTPCADSAVDMYRVACYINQVPSAIEMVEHFKSLGYQTSCNIMAVSKTNEHDLRQALEEVGKSPVDIIYIVDSFGAIYPEDMRRFVALYLEIAEKYGKTLGIHAHNNQQLAFANTIEACAMGVDWLDGTVSGLGRGAGNCYLESLLGFLKNPKYRLEPTLAFIRDHILPLKKGGLVWGYDVPYLLTGVFNSHPSAAIEFIRSGRTDYENLLHDIYGVD